MEKKVRAIIGRKTALVALGWIVFLVGMLVGNPAISISLLAIARVLP